MDSFQDPSIVYYFGLISRPLHFTPKLDSFQDLQQWTVSNITQFSHFKTLISDFNSVLISMGDYLQIDNAKSPWETTFRDKHSKLSTQWFSDLIVKTRRKTHHLQIINTFQDLRSTHPALDAKIFAKTDSFQDPRNFISTVDSNNCVKTLSHQHRHRTRTLLQFISHYCTYSSLTLSSLRAH